MIWIRACAKPFWVNDGQADICYKESRLLLSFSFYTVEKITLSTSAGSRLFELCLKSVTKFHLRGINGVLCWATLSLFWLFNRFLLLFHLTNRGTATTLVTNPTGTPTTTTQNHACFPIGTSWEASSWLPLGSSGGSIVPWWAMPFTGGIIVGNAVPNDNKKKHWFVTWT